MERYIPAYTFRLALCLLLTKGKLTVPATNRNISYDVHTGHVTNEEAKAICEKQGGRLADFNGLDDVNIDILIATAELPAYVSSYVMNTSCTMLSTSQDPSLYDLTVTNCSKKMGYICRQFIDSSSNHRQVSTTLLEPSTQPFRLGLLSSQPSKSSEDSSFRQLEYSATRFESVFLSSSSLESDYPALSTEPVLSSKSQTDRGPQSQLMPVSNKVQTLSTITINHRAHSSASDPVILQTKLSDKVQIESLKSDLNLLTKELVYSSFSDSQLFLLSTATETTPAFLQDSNAYHSKHFSKISDFSHHSRESTELPRHLILHTSFTVPRTSTLVTDGQVSSQFPLSISSQITSTREDRCPTTKSTCFQVCCSDVHLLCNSSKPKNTSHYLDTNHLVQRLAVNHKTTGKHLRRLTSVNDSRRSSRAMGIGAILIICTIMLCIVAMDIPQVITSLKNIGYIPY